jgi:Patatin-like phospholipase
MTPSAEERAAPPPGEGTRWRLAVLIPVMVLSGAAVVWTFLRVWEAQSLLAAAEAPRTWWLAVTFRESTAHAVIGEWRALGLIDEARAAVRADWWMLGAYIAFLSSTGLLLMWFLRYERRSFAPVLLCFPVAGALLGVAENLCVLGMLAEPERPSALLAVIGGVAGTSKFILIAEALLAIAWAVGRLRHRIRRVDAHLLNFSGVLAGEQRYLAQRRLLAGLAPSAAAEGARPIGLALSGGGIRSATFNLGVLQALARLDILRRFDYLSTVSGGGYIGACLTSLLSHRKSWPAGRPRTGPEAYTFVPGETPYFGTKAATLPFNPEVAEQATMREFNGQDEIRHLRTHGDFIIVRHRLLSREVLRAVGNLLGGLFYHLFLFALFLVGLAGTYWGVVALIAGGELLEVGLLKAPDYMWALLDWPLSGELGGYPLLWAIGIGAATTLVSLFAAGLAPYVLPDGLFYVEGQSVEESREYFSLWAMTIVSLVTATVVTIYYVILTGPRLGYLVLPLGVYVGGQGVALLLHPFVSMSDRFQRNDRSRFAAAKGIFNYMTGISLVVLWLPWLAYSVHTAGSPLRVLGGWIVSVAAARFLAHPGGGPEAPAGSLLARITKFSSSIRNALLAVCVVVIVLGGVVLICAALIALDPGGEVPPYVLPFTAGLVALALFGTLGVSLDFNKLSLHYFYRDRLVETYLQSYVSRADERREGYQVLVRDDAEISLTHLHGVARGGTHEKCVTASPFHLVVGALNLTASRDMVRRDRKSDYFVFSRLHCGSETTGYMETAHYRNGDTKLARVMTISGAAASAAMGHQTFLAQSFALTLLNVRLGQWLENPRFRGGRRAHRTETGVFWPLYLLREMLGSTDANRRLINISDGGHTGDNLGICPLLKRRCAIIVASDAEADPRHAFGSLTEALRQIYIDENISVDICLDDLRLDPATGRTKAHHAVGVIRYPRVMDPDTGAEVQPAEIGFLVVLKSSLMGDEPAPILNYKQDNPNFPHQTTGDQFFDDDQFESYRALGARSAEIAFRNVSDTAWEPARGDVWQGAWSQQA